MQEKKLRRGGKPCKPAEEKEEWIYSYGDMVTLLLLFFVIMYSTTEGASPDKIERIANAMASAGLIASKFAIDSKDQEQDALDSDMIDIALRGGEADDNGPTATSGSQRLTHIQPEAEEIIASRTVPNIDQDRRLEILQEKLKKHFPAEMKSAALDPEGGQVKFLDQVLTYRVALDKVFDSQGNISGPGRRWLLEFSKTLRGPIAVDRVDFRVETGRDLFSRVSLSDRMERTLSAEILKLFVSSSDSIAPLANINRSINSARTAIPGRSWLHIQVFSLREVP